jgi:hypothetical protein
MNELKPKDVMRALAWYEVVGKNIGSVTIPYDELQAIATLLREKDAEIKELTDDNKWSAKRIIETDKLVSLLKAENERLTKERDEARSDCAVAEQNHYECKEELETARSEAITEFAERLFETKFRMESGGEYYIYAENIDTIAKELKGETDGKIDL